MGFSSWEAQYLTIPTYITGALGFFLMAWLADRLQCRAPIMLLSNLFTAAGYAVLLGNHTPGVDYFACFLVIVSGYVLPGINITWISGNMSPHYKRATAIAMNQTIGNLGGVIAGQIYLSREKPYYKTGHTISLTGWSLSWFLTMLMWWLLKRGNDQKSKKLSEGEEDNGRGDYSLHFKYLL